MPPSPSDPPSPSKREASVAIDRAADPVIVVGIVGSPAIEQFRLHLGEMDALLERRRPTVMVYDSRLAAMPSTEVRDAQVGWLKARHDLIARYTVGIAFVSESAGFRFMLSSILLFYRMPCEHRVCATLEEAIAWGRGRLIARPAAPR